jgi:hypothetical protein
MAELPISPHASEPVNLAEPTTVTTVLEDGVALCLSGGGYRAMVFHLGPVIRLNEIGLLQKLKRISSVSGISISSDCRPHSTRADKAPDMDRRSCSIFPTATAHTISIVRRWKRYLRLE